MLHTQTVQFMAYSDFLVVSVCLSRYRSMKRFTALHQNSLFELASQTMIGCVVDPAYTHM